MAVLHHELQCDRRARRRRVVRSFVGEREGGG
jgi:hypothetical protein